MAPAKVKTRLSSSCHLSSFVGSGQELVISELPTIRDLLRFGIFLREKNLRDKRNYPVHEMMAEGIFPALMLQWSRANPLFIPPKTTSKSNTIRKLTTCWDQATKYSLGKGKLIEKETFIVKLDKLFDILICKCQISKCEDVNCSGCSLEVHIKCSCPKENKFPIKEASYIRGQRDKVGSKGPHQFGQPDVPETARQMLQLQRKERENQALKRSLLIDDDESSSQSNSKKAAIEYSDDKPSSTDEDSMLEIESKSMEVVTKSRNYDSIRNTAIASIRYGVGLRPTAAIATAALVDAGLITKDNTCKIIDKNKVKRAKEKVMSEMEEEFVSSLKKKGVSCLFFDGRIDITNVMMEVEGSVKLYPARIKEEHYSVVREPDSEYLFHFIPEKSTKEEKHAKQIAKKIYEWLKEKELDETLVAVGGDSTNVNTGIHAGAMRSLELLLNRKLVWLVCLLHTNELPLRRLITNLDGPTLSNNIFSGPIGKLMPSATHLEIDENFRPITTGPSLIDLPDHVIDDLSTDQHYGYRLVKAIRVGVIPRNLALLEIGPVNHSRWLTTANRILRIYVSCNDLSGKDLSNLQLLVEFIVGVYYPCWFMIKVKNKWTEGPKHVLYQLECLKSQSKTVQDIVIQTVKRSAWYAHSENVIQTLLCSADVEDRKRGIEKIVKIRGDYNLDMKGDNSVRSRKTPAINIEATNLLDMIDWNETLEPPLTCYFTMKEIKSFINQPMEVLDWPCHGQSIERAVKMVTEASSKYFGLEKREGAIHTQEYSRRLMAKNESKQDLLNIII